MSDDPLSGREPSLGGRSELTGREPFLGGEGSLAALLQSIDEIDSAPSEVLAGRLAGVIPQLAPLLDSDDPRTRRTAARLLGIVAANHPATREQTIPLLIKTVDDAIRLNEWPTATDAIERLGDTADSRAAAKVVEIVSRGESYHLDQPLASALRRLGSLALPMLMEHALEGSYRARLTQTEALREICATTPEVIPTVSRWLLPLILESQGNEATYMGMILERLSPIYLVEPLLEALTDTTRDMSHRARGLYRIRNIRDPRVSAAMLDILNSDERPLWHIAASGLARIRFRNDIPRVMALIEHPDPDIRRYGIRIAGRRRIKASVPLVIKALAEPQAALRREAARALGRIGHPDGAEPLQPLTEDRAPSVRREAVYALFRIAWYSRRSRR